MYFELLLAKAEIQFTFNRVEEWGVGAYKSRFSVFNYGCFQLWSWMPTVWDIIQSESEKRMQNTHFGHYEGKP